MGIGMILVVPEAQAQAVMDDLAQRGETCYRIGSVVAGNGEVTLKGGEFDHDR